MIHLVHIVQVVQSIQLIHRYMFINKLPQWLEENRFYINQKIFERIKNRVSKFTCKSWGIKTAFRVKWE